MHLLRIHFRDFSLQADTPAIKLAVLSGLDIECNDFPKDLTTLKLRRVGPTSTKDKDVAFKAVARVSKSAFKVRQIVVWLMHLPDLV